MRKIRRLHDDLGLDRVGVEVALRLLDEIDRLRGAPMTTRRDGTTEQEASRR